MGVAGRTPAVNRAVRVLDALARRDGSSPAELADTVGLARSSLADLLTTLQSESLVQQDNSGFRLAGRLPDIVDSAIGADHTGRAGGIVERFLRAVDRTTDLDGHTVSLELLAGVTVVCVDVRMGRLPLRLTPRPGHCTELLDSPGGLAMVAGMTAEQTAAHLAAFGQHQATTQAHIEAVLAARSQVTDGVVDRVGAHGAAQLAVPISVGQIRFLAAVVHLPISAVDGATRKRLSRAVTTVAAAIR